MKIKMLKPSVIHNFRRGQEVEVGEKLGEYLIFLNAAACLDKFVEKKAIINETFKQIATLDEVEEPVELKDDTKNEKKTNKKGKK